MGAWLFLLSALMGVYAWRGFHRLHLDIPDAELEARLAEWAKKQQPDPADLSGYRKLYVQHVLQADEGCDFDFLRGKRGAAVPRHSH